MNKYTIQPASYAYLQDLVSFLTENSSVYLEVSGHTDNDGNAEANRNLSFNRANAIRKYLIVNHIDSNRIVAKGYGDTQPVKPNTTSENKAQNRRVEFLKIDRQ